MSLYILLAEDKPELLDKLPEEIKTSIVMFNNDLDKDIVSLLRSDKYKFEKKYFELVNKFHTHIAQIAYIIAIHEDAHKIIKQFQEIALSSLSQSQNALRDSSNHEAIILVDAIEIVFDFIKIINHPATVTFAFRAYVHLFVCITALYKIIRDRNKLYEKNRSTLIQRCIKSTKQLKDAIEIVTSIKEIERIIKKSDTYLSKKGLLKILPNHITHETLDIVLKHLEFNNKIMYDKDDTIIWTQADESQKRILKKEFTILH